MKVYALLGTFDYEGSCLLGVYTSMEKAEAALVIEKENELQFDEYIINEYVIDAAPGRKW